MMARPESVPRPTARSKRPPGASRRGRSVLGVAAAGLMLGGVAGAIPALAAGPTTALARWTRFAHVPAVVDLSGPRRDGSLTVAADGRLSLLQLGSRPTPFARGPGGYTTARGPEPYIASSAGEAPTGAGCRFAPDDVYALEPKAQPGVVQITAAGQVHGVTGLPAGVAPNGIVFDDVGRFGHRLLVTAAVSGGTAVYALDCTGRVTTITDHAPSLEGGVAVAPANFGAFAGDLIGPDEHSGRIVAVGPAGDAQLVVESGLPSGADIGVESIGVIPPAVANSFAYLADRRSPGNPHPGTDSILRIAGTQLARAGAVPGDLLVATEGGAKTIVVHCSSSCTARHVADGPAVAHGEGHIVFASPH